MLSQQNDGPVEWRAAGAPMQAQVGASRQALTMLSHRGWPHLSARWFRWHCTLKDPILMTLSLAVGTA
jgi:hypothetical protein